MLAVHHAPASAGVVSRKVYRNLAVSKSRICGVRHIRNTCSTSEYLVIYGLQYRGSLVVALNAVTFPPQLPSAQYTK